jgi:nitrite reductase/ring-hydroxylating ferredoxin subunit
MSWLTERLKSALQDRQVNVEAVARQLAIERSRLTQILAGSAIPNESLVKRLAKYFGEDVDEWIKNSQKRELGRAVSVVPTGFTKVATLSEIPDGEMKVVAGDLAVIAHAEGKFYAFGNVCPHAAGPIGEGFLDGCIVECPWHAGRWDIKTGKALTLLATADIPLFEVRVAGEDIEIRLSQAALTQGVVSKSGPNPI